jgi:hypothetical protein
VQVEDTEQGNEPTLLDQLVEQVSKEPDPEKQPEIDPDDRDAVEEAAAAKALADEEAKAATPVKAVEEPAKPAEQAKPAQAGRDEQIRIPKPRFDEVAKQRDDALMQAAYWKGVADTRQAGTTEPEPKQPTPQQQLAELDTKRDALAAQVDDGKLLMSDFVKEERKLRLQEDAIRDTMRKPAADQDPKSASDLYLDAKTEELETAHPYVPLLDADDLSFLTRKAVASLADEGVKLPKGDLAPRDALMLRTRIAQLSDTFGPALTGKTLAPRQTPAAKPGLSPAAKNLQTKLQAAQDAPPDLTAAGRGGAPMEYTDAQILAMTQDEMDALPAATLEKIMARQQS